MVEILAGVVLSNKDPNIILFIRDLAMQCLQ